MEEIHNQKSFASKATPFSFRWVSFSLFIGVILAHFYYTGTGLCNAAFPPWRTAALIGFVAILLGLEIYERQRYRAHMSLQAAILLLAARMILIEGVAAFDCAGYSKFLYLIVPFTAYFYFGKRISYGMGLAYWGFLAAKLVMQDPQWYLNREYLSVLLIFSIGVVFVITMAGVVSDADSSRARAEKLLRELETSHHELQAYAERVAELAAVEERNRLARDIHDSLGHYLTAINVQLEKAMAFRERNPSEADQALRDAKRAAQEALRDVRQSVGALRDSRKVFSLAAALSDLVDGLKSSPLSLELHLAGDEESFSKPVLMALYRAVQEGLTNVQKHAQASQVVVDVNLKEHEACLHLSDNGRGFDPALLNHLAKNRLDHFGLQGVQERIELVGGQMRIESMPGTGTRWWITIPKYLTVTASNPLK